MRTVAIIGAGFSGTMVTVHLLRRALQGQQTPDRIILFERSGRFTAGVAYGTTDPLHLLNVPAGRMSAFEDDPENFLRWAKARNPKVTGGSFMPRRMYGEYLASLLRDTEAATVASGSTISLERAGGEVTAVRSANGVNGTSVGGTGGGTHGEWIIETAQGERHEVDGVVLAIGNFAPACPLRNEDATRLASAGRYAADPWAPDALNVDPQSAVLMVGSGLTMLDLALSLRRRDHKGPIYALSRRGLLPQAHRISATHPAHYPRPADLHNWPGTARGLLRALRSEVEKGADLGVDWREVVTSIRHDTQPLWIAMNNEERRKFLRHLRPYWETHRHRSSPETASAIDAMIGEGQLRVLAGRLLSTQQDAGGDVRVTYCPRGTTETAEISVARIVNCTGPDTDLSRVGEPLISSMRDAGLIRPDPLGLGLESDDHGTIIDASGSARRGLYLVGSLRKGKLWENTAVPELRGEAERMAGLIATGQPRVLSRAAAHHH